MMFMISGRATNANGSPIVRDGVVAAIHEAGHSVVTAQPRRGSYAYVDYLVATSDSIRRHVAKVRWAAERGIGVIDYRQLWQLIDHGIAPAVQELPADAAIPLSRPARTPLTPAQAMEEVYAQEALERRNREDEEDFDRLRDEARQAAEAQHTEIPRSAGTYNSATEETRERPAPPPKKAPVVGQPRRRRIVTGR